MTRLSSSAGPRRETPQPQPSLFERVPDRVQLANPVKVERARLNAAALRVLEYLKAHGSATNWQLCTPEVGGLRACGARIPELRAEGWLIEAKRESGGTWRYVFKGLRK